MNTEVLVEESRVVEGNTFETFELCCEFVEFSQTSTTFLFDSDLDVTNPTTLKFNALSDDLLFEPEKCIVSVIIYDLNSLRQRRTVR